VLLGVAGLTRTRRILTEPLAPFALATVAGALAAVQGVDVAVWLLAALVAGHSLSGSA
jgi:hypothetical protein